MEDKFFEASDSWALLFPQSPTHYLLHAKPDRKRSRIIGKGSVDSIAARSHVRLDSWKQPVDRSGMPGSGVKSDSAIEVTKQKGLYGGRGAMKDGAAKTKGPGRLHRALSCAKNFLASGLFISVVKGKLFLCRVPG